MSSALKPVLTPSGAQNPPVPPQLNKPMHPQGPPTTYGQPMSHIPQNLVNIPHNAPSSTNVHNPAHSNTHNVPHHINTNAHVTGHSANHYSLNVPNASQHYPVSGNTPVSSHSAPVSNHPVANTSQSHTPPATFSTPPKNLSYNPNYQANLGHSYKMPSVVPTTQSLPASQPQVATAASEESPAEKPQSNGTPEVKVPSKPEPPQNHISAPVVKDKPPPPTPLPTQTPAPEKTKATPEKPVTATVPAPVEQKQNADVNKPSEVISTPASSDKNSASTAPPAPAVSAASPANAASSANAPSVTVSSPPSSTTVATTTASTTTTTTAEATVTTTTTSTSAAPVQTTPSVVSTSVPETQESQDSVVNVTTTITNKPKEQTNQKPTLKLATTPRTPARKIKPPKPESSDSPKAFKSETKLPIQKSPGSGGKTKRNRIRTQPYQCPLPEVEMISKISATTPRSKNIEDKLIIFYKNEFLAVRNAEGGFYVCQAVQNIYKSSPRIRIRWLSQDKSDKEIYTPDFYDNTDFDCILTNINLSRVGKGKYKLPPNEKVRTDSILKRALAVEKGDATPPSLTEEHPDGLDLSLYKEESQLKKRKAVKRKATTLLKATAKPAINKKSPDQPKVRKVLSKPKVPAVVKKATVLKRALSAKVKKAATGRSERAAKRQQDVTKSAPKTSPVIDQKKAKVLAKVARKTVVAPPPKIQPPPKQYPKAVKPAASSSKKPVAVKKPIVTRKSKREKK